MRINDPTPWGPAETVATIADGIYFVSTPSHGGFYLKPELNALVPSDWRAASFNGRAQQGWYEEDCDWCMVVLTFPDHFKAEERAQARGIFDGWLAPKLGKAA